MSAAFAEGGRQRILEQGMALSGLESAPQQAELLLDTLTAAALGWCCREDIPEEMEGAMAVLLAQTLKEGNDRPVTTVKRGDTAITYADTGAVDRKTLLAPFVRLKTPERRWEYHAGS